MKTYEHGKLNTEMAENEHFYLPSILKCALFRFFRKTSKIFAEDEVTLPKSKISIFLQKWKTVLLRISEAGELTG